MKALYFLSYAALMLFSTEYSKTTSATLLALMDPEKTQNQYCMHFKQENSVIEYTAL